MSSTSIYKSVTNLNDSQLEKLVSDCQNIISRGKRAAVELCIKMAETDDYLNTMKKKDKKVILSTVVDKLGVKQSAFYKYANIGRHVKTNPALQDMSMKAITDHMKPPKQLAAPAPKLPKVDKDQMIKDHEQRIRDLERKVKELENEVEYKQEEVGDLRKWLDTNYIPGGSVAVYKKLRRNIH